jgi:hypothetical protein
MIQGVQGGNTGPTRDYRVVLEDAGTEEVLADEEVEGFWNGSNYEVVYHAPPGALSPRREYRVTFISPNGEGRSQRKWLSFNTGDPGNKVDAAGVAKEHHRDADGDEQFVFLAQLVSQDIRRAHLRDPDGNLLTLKKVDPTYYRLRLRFPTVEAMDQALRDGRYRFELEYEDGTPSTQRFFDIAGDYPSFPEITTPVDGEKKVDRQPGFAWLYPIGESIGGFSVLVSEVSSGVTVWSASENAGTFDTRVRAPRSLRADRKHELSVGALGYGRKNSTSSIRFTTK